MKLWQKIFLSSFLTSIILFLLCGFLIIVMDLNMGLQEKIATAESYRDFYSTRIQKYCENGLPTWEIIRQLDSIQEILAMDNRYIRFEVDGSMVYDPFRREPPAPRYRTNEDGNASTPDYIKDIGDARYLFVDSSFYANGSACTVTFVEDITPLYASCNSQMRLLLMLGALQSFLLAVIMFLVTKGITSPIERLNNAAKILSKNTIAVKIPVEGEDEVSDLINSFNQMSNEIALNLENYKQMIGNLTHEIKTPLTSIIGYAELIKSPKCTDKMQAECVDYIICEGKRLHAIIYKMIHLSQLRPEQMSIEKCDVAKLLETSMMTVKAKAEQKQVSFMLNGASDEIYCYGDKELIITTIVNVLDNAIKASHPGGSIEINIVQKANALQLLQITDHGIGIAPEEFKKLCLPFYVSDKSRSSQSDGLGLGLSICKLVMQYHKGEITFDSRPGEYTTVTLHFSTEFYEKMEQEILEKKKEKVPLDDWNYGTLKFPS